MRGLAKVDGQLAAEAEITCVIVERDEKSSSQ
jgi:hypothetical protein